jgi:hypothetical protein
MSQLFTLGALYLRSRVEATPGKRIAVVIVEQK